MLYAVSVEGGAEILETTAGVGLETGDHRRMNCLLVQVGLEHDDLLHGILQILRPFRPKDSRDHEGLTDVVVEGRLDHLLDGHA